MLLEVFGNWVFRCLESRADVADCVISIVRLLDVVNVNSKANVSSLLSSILEQYLAYQRAHVANPISLVLEGYER